ncbi:type VI secretion system tip protein VgrG [Aquabacterium lacunae]|uniref:Type VI secretion system tip protein VgrG n=1 Tax=Aquabacterium lacunae TaxID=2528630 RepID=A0A4Q9H2C0_9BURK|nr:type VI secretion system Vgr family protein [Aquabacterium lacunae]TBO32741.1 type VI secretion system tip protein VgrG [Aquabacterium lacunae]
MASSMVSGTLATALSQAVPQAIEALLQQWHSHTRLYTLETFDTPGQSAGPLADLMVEGFVLVDDLSQPYTLHLHTLSRDAALPLEALYARPVTLVTRLADGSDTRRSGYVTEAIAQESDGGFARYTLVVRPWVALLAHTRCSRTWQDLSLIDIVDDVLADHAGIAAWRWDDDVPQHVAQGLFARNQGQRAHCTQYRESDFDFIQRLLAEEGIGWRVEEDASAPGGHRMVFFVSSRQQPQDDSSQAQGGIRFHRASSQEIDDAIQALGSWREMQAIHTTVLGWDYKAHAAITADAPSAVSWGGPEAQSLQTWLSSYDPTGCFLFSNTDEARFAATRLQEAREARLKTWLGRGTVRTLRPGRWCSVTQSTLDTLQAFEALQKALAEDAAAEGAATQGSGEREFFCTHVHSVGINNLPRELNEHLARHLGADIQAVLHDTFEAVQHQRATPDLALPQLVQQAERSGFAMQFQAVRRNVPWRPVLLDETGWRLRPRPTAPGPQTAIVVGPDGSTQAQGEQELYTDALGRIKVQFHWQAAAHAPQRANTAHSCWLRVAQRSAGAGMGQVHLPRIGQEVLVGFLGQDIDRPVVVGSLYNGRGESGVPRTPGGEPASPERSALAASTDHQPASQLNLVGSGSGGNSPAWHGAAAGEAALEHPAQNNAAALSGVKSKEFGGTGHNQLVFDDTPAQQRLQLHTTQAQTWLQMGHLLHQADNHRGSFRGEGFELRTDAWGAVRAAQGLLLSTYALRNGPGQTPEPAGDNAPGLALARQAQQLAAAFQQAARTHQTVGLASAAGSSRAGQCSLSEQRAPAEALSHSLAGMVNASSLPEACTDAASQATATTPGKVPHMAHPHVALVGKAGVGLSAGQDLHISSQDTTVVASGQDTHWAVGGQARVHTAQAIGLLAGAMQPGDQAAGKGLSLIAAQGPIDLQAQAGPAQVAAKGTLEIKTANGVVNIAAAKKVVLAVSGGASITIEGGSFTAQCPGKITVKAGKKSMVGGGSMGHVFPNFEPVGFGVHHSLRFAPAGSDAMAEDLGWVGKAFSIKDEAGKILASGVVGPDGRLPRVETSGAEKLTLTIGSNRVQVTEILKPSADDEFLDELHTSAEHDPYLEKLTASDPVEGDFLAPAILAKIMGRPGDVDE